MTISETERIVESIAAAYPLYFNEASAGMLGCLAALSCDAYKDYSYEQVHEGLIRYIQADGEGVPPCPGQIIKRIPSPYEAMLIEAAEIDRRRILGNKNIA